MTVNRDDFSRLLFYLFFSNVSLTVHLSTTLANDQIDA